MISILPVTWDIANLKLLACPLIIPQAVSTMRQPSLSGTWNWEPTPVTGLH